MKADTTIDRTAELDRLEGVLGRGFPVLEAWEVGLLLGSDSSTRQGLGEYARALDGIPMPAIRTTQPKWAPGAIRAFLAGEWKTLTLLDEVAS